MRLINAQRAYITLIFKELFEPDILAYSWLFVKMLYYISFIIVVFFLNNKPKIPKNTYFFVKNILTKLSNYAILALLVINQSTMYEDLLISLGLNKNEAEIYEILLTLGKSTVKDVLKKTKIQRSNVYNILSVLKEKGLIQEGQNRRGLAVYFCENPDKLRLLLHREKEKLDDVKEKLDRHMRELKDTFIATQEKPIVRYVEGFEDYKKIYELAFETKEKESLIFTSTLGNDMLDNYLTEYGRRKVAAGLKTKLFSSKEVNVQRLKNDVELNKERRYMDEKLPAEVAIYGKNTVAFLCFKNDPIGVVIENEQIAEAMTKIFNFIWRTCPNPYKELGIKIGDENKPE